MSDLRERVANRITEWWQMGCNQNIDDVASDICDLLPTDNDVPTICTRCPTSPSEAGLKAAVLNQFTECPDETRASFYVSPNWYAPKWGCDTLDHILDAVSALAAAPAETEKEVVCPRCFSKMETRNICPACGCAAYPTPAPDALGELSLYKEAWEARHNYGHKQGIGSPQAIRLREAEAAVKAFRETAPASTAKEGKGDVLPFDGQSFNAQDWAKAFCARNPWADEGTMIGWFANAIMRGYDTAKSTPASTAKEGT